MSAVSTLPADPILERRALVQATARRSLGRRTFVSRLMLGVCSVALGLCVAILGWIIYLLISKGIQYISVSFFTQDPGTPTILEPNNIGGIKNAIVGSIVIDSLAIVMAVPVGIVAGLLLAESDNRFVNAVRSTTEVMTGLPSILLGVFVYEILVIRYKLGFSGIAGSVALAILMIPIIMKASEVAFRGVAGSLREAGLSLGLSKGRVARRIIVPTATPGLLTAVLLAASRAIGETAPLLWVIGATYTTSWDPFKEQAALPLAIYQPFLNGISPQLQQSAWGTALVLVTVVLFLNLGSRLVAAYSQRERR
jgi:phosphate transport system permease protein